MTSKILVTDSLFISEEHISKLQNAGYEVERLDTPSATEEQLIEAVKDKTGYILGGVEKVTDKVIEAARDLKAIIFTGADYKHFIPGWQAAKNKGIDIANTPGANSHAVSEFAVSLALMMQRNVLELGRAGSKKFQTTNSIAGARVGVIGAGRIGERIIKIINSLEPDKVFYYSREKKEVDADYVGLDSLLSESDIIFVNVPSSAGCLIDKKAIAKIRPDALIVSVSAPDVFDMEELLVRMKESTIRVAIDHPASDDRYDSLPLSVWYSTNHTAYNTHQANKLASDMAVESILNLLSGKDDKYRVE